MSTPNMNAMVYLNLQLPEHELDWLSTTLLEKLNDHEHVWTHREHELGPNALPLTMFEKVTGRTHTVFVRILCSHERAERLLELLRCNRHPNGILWQMQGLFNQVTL